MASPYVDHISECYIKPKHEAQNSTKPYYLGPMDLAMLSSHYIQNGLLFLKPSLSCDNHQGGESGPCLSPSVADHSKKSAKDHWLGQPLPDQLPNTTQAHQIAYFSIHKFIESLKNSLSLTLVHFYPLVGQLDTKVDENNHNCVVYVDCNKGLGAKFIHASLQMSIVDILSPVDVPGVVNSFFDHHGAVNHDGHSQSLLSIQVTELSDGIFIGCSMNHTLADGTSFWNFWNVWSSIHMNANNEHIQSQLNLPVMGTWLGDGENHALKLPYTHPDQFITRYQSTDHLRKRIFHFSSKTIAKLKAKANDEMHMKEISSLQALLALVWRSIAHANNLPVDHVTNLVLIANNRHRLNPPLPQNYFGNHINIIIASTKVDDLQTRNLGCVAYLLHRSVKNYNDKAIRNLDDEWLQSPSVPKLDTMFNPSDISVTHSPKFNIYGNEFGLGKPITVLSGFAHRFVGVMSAYPGYEGRGSVDLEICLTRDSMARLESKEEFKRSVSTPQHLVQLSELTINLADTNSQCTRKASSACTRS